MTRQHRRTSTEYQHPYRPRLLAAANRLGLGLEGLGVRADLSLESLLASARRKQGLTDFGGQEFVPGLEVLLDSIEREAALNPIGRLITRARLVNILGNRLRATRHLAEHPEIEAQEVAPLIVVTGLQRTGTTMLQRLLAADPETRGLASWEAINPAPPLPYTPGQADTRGRFARLSALSLSYMAPDFFAIHPVEADSPEEDVLLFDFAFLSTVFESTLRVPTYAHWLEEQDLTPGYEYERTLLKLLQWQRPAWRWALKTPHHLEFLDLLLEVFPRTVVVWTHRDPCVAVASFASMIAHGRGIFSDQVDPREVGGHWFRKQRRMVERAMAVRAKSEDARFIDVYYDDLMADPMAQVARIYERAGITMTEAARRAMHGSLAVNVQHKYGHHRYRLEDFGFEPRQVYEGFAEYYRRFGVRRELAGEGRPTRRSVRRREAALDLAKQGSAAGGGL